jgi:hypothetical protein
MDMAEYGRDLAAQIPAPREVITLGDIRSDLQALLDRGATRESILWVIHHQLTD